MNRHLKKCHGFTLMTFYGKDWAVSRHTPEKLLIHYRSQEQAAVLRSDTDASAAVKSTVDSLPGEQCCRHTIYDHLVWSHSTV